MATEKLTKKRLVQIILMLCVLVSAFLYRTCHYDEIKSAVQNQQVSENKKTSD